MKIQNLIISAGIAVAAFAQAAPETTAKEAYIFSYFCGQSDGLHLAVSDDGLNWTALNGNKSVLKPTVGKDRLMRDPSICRGPDGVYRMVWTTSWHDRIIGYAETRDFVNWSEQRAIPVMEYEKGCRNCWAPELTYDPDTGTYHIYWASTISGRGDGHRIYRTTTRDFKTFTPTEKWFDPGFSVIDAAIVRDSLTHDWVMTIKDEREKPVAKKHILTTRTKSLDKGFPTKLDGPINFGPDWVEGPSPFLVGKEIYVCFDNYRRGRYNMISSSDGGKTWKDRTAELHLPKGIRHGTVIAVPKQEKDALVERFRAGAFGAPRGLTVERLENPCGVDAPSPRFGWKMASKKVAKGVVQSAYRIMVASTKGNLAADKGDLWDTGKVSSADTIDVEYGGKPLASSRRYWWKVRTWDGSGAESDWSAPATWVTGIMPGDGWKAKWIGPAPETHPDADLSGARWITAKPNARGDVVISLDFDFSGAKPGEYVELLHAASTRHEIDVNGKEFHRHAGQVDRWNHLRFRDMTPWLKAGKNTMTVRVKKGAKGVPQAFICALRFPDGRRIVTNGTLGNDLGALRDTPYGKALVTREEIASPAFEKKIAITKPIVSAFLHVTGVGFYEASLNGRKIGDKVLDPSPTAYDKHVLYSTYDLGSALKPGENTLKVLVGHGWYDVRSIAVWNFDVAPWRDFPRMIAQLKITYADGTRETIVSDGSWRQVESPVGYDCIREGEVIGAHHPAQPDFAKREIRAVEVSAPKGALVAENCPGAKVLRTIAPKAIHAFPDGTYVVEFPENFAGWIRMDVRGQKKGDVLVIRYDERANRDFAPASVRRIDCHFRYTASQAVCATGAAFQTDRFVSSGAAVERYEPRFTYNGFQYVVLKGLRAAPRKEDITGCVVHTDFPAIGSFACSDETFNTLMLMGDRAYRSNFADGYPTDCPHREKNGWTGDASIASELAQYCYENTAAYEKWLRDIMDTQLANGDICCIVPTSGWGFRWGNGPAWDSALPVVAWNLWCYRGDRRILDVVYPALKRYVGFTSTKARGNLVRHGLGDWIPVERRHMPSTELTSSCYYRQAAAILARIAAIKGLADDAARYAKLADAIKNAINAKFYKGNGVYDNGHQTAQAFPLAFGVVSESERAAVEAKLVESVEREGCHVDIGLLGSKHVFRALSRAGRTDLAFKMLTNPTKPSPVEWIQKGGTTLWEDWGDGASRNHIMFGDFMAWAYQYIGGIQLPEKNGSCAAIPDVSATAFREVVIAPQFIDALTWAKVSVNGPNGPITTAWRRDGKKVALDVTVPPNTTAIVRLPGQPDRRIGSGDYSFTAIR